MTVQECYEIIKGDYAEAVNTYRTDDKIKKALRKAVNDSGFANLCAAVDGHNAQAAYNAANTLKSMYGTLGLTTLNYSAATFAEALSGDGDTGELYRQLKKDYALTMACIRLLVDD